MYQATLVLNLDDFYIVPFQQKITFEAKFSWITTSRFVVSVSSPMVGYIRKLSYRCLIFTDVYSMHDSINIGAYTFYVSVYANISAS